jgi:hypothetical protein
MHWQRISLPDPLLEQGVGRVLHDDVGIAFLVEDKECAKNPLMLWEGGAVHHPPMR